MELTNHARKQMQRRGISPLAVDMLAVFGEQESVPGDALRMRMDKKKIKRLRDLLDRLAGIEIVVTPQGLVLTAMHKTRRHKS